MWTRVLCMEFIFIFLRVDIQLCQHHSLNMLSFFHLILFASLSKIRCTKMCGLIIWVFCSVPLGLLSVLRPVPGCFQCCSLQSIFFPDLITPLPKGKREEKSLNDETIT